MKLNLKKIVKLERCIVNICSRDYANAVTVDLTKNEVTYVHDSLWISKGEGCIKEAKDVLSLLQWLIEDKKFKVAAKGSESYYRELVAHLGGK